MKQKKNNNNKQTMNRFVSNLTLPHRAVNKNEVKETLKQQLRPIIAGPNYLIQSNRTYKFNAILFFFFSSAVKCLPRFARSLDTLAENGTAFPDNLVEAQADRHSVCARISIAFPEREPGDGDGLPESSVLDFHGLYQNDQPIVDDEIMRGWEYLRPPCGYRCRLVGFDTQESPASRGMPIDDVRQPFWREGRQLLVDLLGDLRNGEDPANLTILADCYGMDLFQRILLDIRGASTVFFFCFVFFLPWYCVYFFQICDFIFTFVLQMGIGATL